MFNGKMMGTYLIDEKWFESKRFHNDGKVTIYVWWGGFIICSHNNYNLDILNGEMAIETWWWSFQREKPQRVSLRHTCHVSCLKKMMGKWLSENDGNDNIRFMNGKAVCKKKHVGNRHTQLPVGKKRFHQPIYCDLGDDLLVAFEKKKGEICKSTGSEDHVPFEGGSEVQQPMSKKMRKSVHPMSKPSGQRAFT